MSKKDFSVIVVGAGISGLQVATLFLEKNINVSILEARENFGGRIQDDKEFVDFPIDLGAEEIHGQKSPHMAIAKKIGAKFVNSDNYYDYIEFESKLYREDELKKKEKSFQRVSQFEDCEINSCNISEDMSVEEFVKKKKISQNLYHVIESFTAIEMAAPMDQLSVKLVKKYNDNWDFGDKNYILTNTSNFEILKQTYSEAIKHVKLNTPIVNINYDNDKVILKDINNVVYESNIVILTIPISQFKNNSISFYPEFSETRKQAIEKIGYGPIIKFIMKFNERICNEDLGVLVSCGIFKCGWCSSLNKSKKYFTLTTLISGEQYEKVSMMNEKKFIENSINELSNLFKKKDLINKFEGYILKDWKKERYIEGGYSYFKIGESNETRKQFYSSIEKKLYFGGEALNREFKIACVGGAIESAYSVFDEVNNHHKLF